MYKKVEYQNEEIGKFGCVLVYRYTKEGNTNELRHNSMYGYENKRNSLVYRYTRTAPKIWRLNPPAELKRFLHPYVSVFSLLYLSTHLNRSIWPTLS